MRGINAEYFSKGFEGIIAVSEKATYMNTTMDGVISINFATDDNGFNAGESIVSAFRKLSENGTLTRDEEYSIEILWHEILHNKSLNTMVLPPVEATDKGFTRTVAETINQLDARHTYGTLLSHFGREPGHRDWVIGNGYGYNETVSNLRLLLNAANINESEFVKRADAILMKDYTDIDKKISALLLEMNQNKELDIEGLFKMIEIKNYSRFF